MVMFILGAVFGACAGMMYTCLLVINQPDDWKDNRKIGG